MIRSWYKFLIRDVFLPLILVFLYHRIHWTGAAQILSQALLKVLPEGVQVNLELRTLGLVLILYTPLFRGVVQGFSRGCSWAEDVSSAAGATFTMLSSFSLVNNAFPPWSFNGNPICVRGLARERLVYPQGCRLSQDESSLSFTMLQGSIFWKIPPPGGGKNIGRCHMGEKIWKGKEQKGKNVKEKERKRKEKERKEKENEKRGSKRVK